MSELVDLGKLVRRHGVRGEIRLLPYNPGSPVLGIVDKVALCDGSTEPVWVHVSGVRPHKNFILMRFEGVDTVEQADALIGRRVAVRRDQLPPLDDRGVYHCDLIGCSVVTDTGDQLGTVDEILPTGSNDVLVVRGDGREHLIPWIDDVVLEVDPSVSRIVIHPIPGLLDP